MANRKIKAEGDRSKCYWCGSPLQWKGECKFGAPNDDYFPTKDHVVPRALGGTKVVWCCYACNQIKGNLEPWQFARLLGALPTGLTPQIIHNTPGIPRGDALWKEARKIGLV